MRKTNQILALAAMTVLPMTAAQSLAAAYTWSAGTGTQAWSTGWTPAAYPNTIADTGTIPSLSGNLGVNIDVANALIGQLTFGSIGFNVDIGNANSTGNRLSFDNTGGANNTDANANAAITSVGTGTNTISSLVSLGGNNLSIVAASTNSLNLSGGLLGTTTSVTTGTTNAPAATRQVVNNLAAGKILTIGSATGTLVTEQAGATAASVVALQFGVGSFAATPTTAASTLLGTTDIAGVIANGANSTGGFAVATQAIYGSSGANNSNAIGTVILEKANTYTGGSRLFRVNLVLGDNAALGTGAIQHGSGAASGAMGFNIASNDDSRTIANAFTMQRNLTFNGSNSLTWNGAFTQTNASALFNLISSNKTLTLGGTIFADNGTSGKAFTFEGTGTTVVSGDIQNNNTAANTAAVSQVIKNGTGDTTLNGTALIAAGTGITSYSGLTAVNGGTLTFNNLTTGTGTSTASINVNAGAGVALATGSLNSALLTKLSAGVATNTGAILLVPSTTDTSTAVNFAGLGNAANLSLGAKGAVTYTGAITPAASAYRLGGPGGTLTLGNANALSGGNALVVVNGGTVALPNANSYTGATSIQGNWIVTQQQTAASNNGAFIPAGVYVAPTLAVSNLNAGTSSLGSTPSIAVNGGTLSYVGSTDSTTSAALSLGATGATLDSSGAGAVSFAGAVTSTDAGAINGTITAGNNTITAVTGDISNLAIGSTLPTTNYAAGTTIIGITPTYSATSNALTYTIRTSANASTAAAAGPIAITGQNRMLTLTGSNAGANSIAGALTDSATGKLSVTKTGAGSWALGGTNTYTGATTVSAGTLAVNTPSAISATSLVTVGGGATAAAYKIGWNGVATTATIPLPTLSANGKFDIGIGRVVLTGTTAAAVQALVGNGSTGSVFTSSADAAHNVGYGDVGAGGITVRYTLLGDADLNGSVNFNDFLALQNNFGQSGVFSQGDFDYNGVVNFNDFLALQNNFGLSVTGAPVAFTSQQVAAMTAFAYAVPEPTSLAVLGLGAAAMLRRRRA